jgi:hypothetical protein
LVFRGRTYRTYRGQSPQPRNCLPVCSSSRLGRASAQSHTSNRWPADSLRKFVHGHPRFSNPNKTRGCREVHAPVRLHAHAILKAQGLPHGYPKRRSQPTAATPSTTPVCPTRRQGCVVAHCRRPHGVRHRPIAGRRSMAELPGQPVLPLAGTRRRNKSATSNPFRHGRKVLAAASEIAPAREAIHRSSPFNNTCEINMIRTAVLRRPHPAVPSFE